VTLAVLALWLAQPMLDVQGESTCPTSAEVSERLARLVPPGGPGRPGRAPHALLSDGKKFVNIELVGPDGGLLAERRLERAAPCSDLAEAVAVILAAWLAKFSPALAAAEVLPPPSPPAVVNPRRVARLDLGIAGLLSLVGGQAVWGGKLEGMLFPFGIPLGFDGAFSLTATHTQSFAAPPVEAKWIRPALSLGPDLRLSGRRSALDMHANAVLALLHVEGQGLQQISSDTGPQFGLSAGLRGLWTWSRGAAWAGADLFIYPGRDRLTVANHGEVGALPHLELQIALGVSLGRFE
jgi:hypothetical protein